METSGFIVYSIVMGKKLFVSLCVSVVSFLSLLSPILRNNIIYQSDEMYWVQTGRILQLILNRKFDDKYWNEHMGFTNFNGAKWIYAIGLRSFGHSDFSSINYPPTHIDQFKNQDGVKFSTNVDQYTFLIHGRLVSAIFASFSVGILFAISMLLFNKHYGISLLTAILLRIHPTLEYIATHALADSMLLTFQMLSLLLIIRIIHIKHYASSYVLLFLGIFLGYAAAVKINGVMFSFLFVFTMFVLMYKKNISPLKIFQQILYVLIVAIFTFICLHPNFFFFPKYTFLQMIIDRIHITQYHMQYFSRIDPPHVLYGLSDRLHAIYTNTLTPSLFVMILVSILTHIVYLIVKRRYCLSFDFVIIFLHIALIVYYFLWYAVFNDARYFLPLVPYIIFIAVSWIPTVMISLKKDKKVIC